MAGLVSWATAMRSASSRRESSMGLRGVRACAVAAGTEHSLVVDVSGAVYSFGHGGFGTLGHGDEEIQFTPRVIEALRSVCMCAVDAGCAHNLVLGAGGE
eukprot:7375840-Prymnesium_polylepis.1